MKLRALAVGLVLLSASHAHAVDRNAALINNFQVLCFLDEPQFERIDKRAAAMRLTVISDIGESRATGIFAHVKSWAVPLADGPYQLIAEESNGPNGYLAGCGIGIAAREDGEAFKKELIAEMKLGKPSSETLTDGIARVTVWPGPPTSGGRSILTLVDATPKAGATLSWTVLGPARP